MLTGDFDRRIRDESIDYSMIESVDHYNYRRFCTTIRFAVRTIFTFGIYYLVYRFITQKIIKQLKIGQAANTLVQRQLQILHRIKNQTETLQNKQKFFDNIIKSLTISKPSYYAKKITDAENIEGAAYREREHRYRYRGSAEDFEPKEHPELFSKNSSAEHLYQSAFAHIFEELINNPNILFSKNKKIHKSGLYEQQKSAFVRLIILDLIKEAELETPPCGQGNPNSHLEILHLNNAVSVKKSTSTEIYQQTKDGSYKTSLMYLSQDAFTPLTTGSITGEIDPIGVKWILEKTSPQDLEILKSFLIRSLYPGNSPLLADASSKIKPSNDLGYAAAMIEKIASGVEKRFASQFNALWEYYAKDTEGNLPEQTKETSIVGKTSNRIFSKQTPNKQTTSKAARVTINILKYIGIFIANILTLNIYSIANYTFTENKINSLNPTTGPMREATQKKLYKEIRNAKHRLEAVRKSFSEKPRPDLVIVNENNCLKSYKKTLLDDDTIPKKTSSENDVDDTLYGWRVSCDGSLKNQTMIELLETAFDKTYENLMELASNGEISFSRNETLKYFEVDNPNGNALQKPLTRLVVFDLIKNASLTKAGDVHRLHLNNTIFVGKSQPTEVFNIKTQNTERVYLDEDDWTPPPIRDNLVNPVGKGIDPIGVKWLLEKLSDAEINQLTTLLLNEYYPEESNRLKEVKDFIISNSETNLNVIRAFNMICEIAKSIDTRYKGLIRALWIKNANDEDPTALMPPRKSPIDIPADYEKLPANNVEWIPGVRLKETLKTAFEFSKNRLSLIWNNFSEEDLLKPMKKDLCGKSFYVTNHNHVENTAKQGKRNLTGLQLYNKQFYEKHELFGGGCLYGALTCSLFQETNLNSSHAQLMKSAMADYVDLHKDEYRSRIQKETNLEFSNFQKWLRGNLENERETTFSDLEVEIFAYTFGIRVEVFSETMLSTVNEHGLIQSEAMSFGPRTKECLFLRNKNGYSWYAAQPTFKTPDENDYSKRADAIRKHNLVWSNRAYGWQ